MQFIDFPQSNCKLAEDQPEYQTLPVYADVREIKNPMTGETVPAAWSMTCVSELSDEEIEEVMKTRKIYYRQMLFGRQFLPIFLSVKDPFQPENKVHWPQE